MAGVAGTARLAAMMEASRQRELHRVARLMHDEVGPLLCTAGIQVELLRPQAGAAVQPALDHLDQAMAAVRRVTSRISPETLQRRGLAGALRQLAATKFKVAADAADFSGAERAGLYEIGRELAGVAVEAACAGELTLTADGLTAEVAATLEPDVAEWLELWAQRGGLRLELDAGARGTRVTVRRGG